MISFNEHRLDNGLRLVHHLDNTTQMVALNILYRVGSVDEDSHRTGFAHLFEHLMFGGSVNIPDYDTAVQMAGGENNAFTTADYTNFYITVPQQNVETAFWLESDRMLSLAFTPRSLEVQRHVVIEEFKQRYLNQPYGDVYHLMSRLAYTTHPYRWPTIGLDISHIEEATLEEVKQFFSRFYAPSNAVLAIAGNLSFDEAKRLTEKWFGDISDRTVERRAIPVEPKQTAMRRMEVERAVPADSLYMAFRMSDRLSSDYYTFDLLSDLLSNGNSSRFQQTLVKGEARCATADAYISGSYHPGLFHIVAKPVEGVSLSEVEECVWRELRRLQEETVAEEELEKVKNRYESAQIFGNLNYLNVAQQLAYYAAFTDVNEINRSVEHYRAVTAADIQRVAKEAFVETNCCVIRYLARRS